MPPWLEHLTEVSLALFIVLLNGFFVAAEFALVKVRGSQIDELVRQKKTFAKTAKWLSDRLEPSLAAGQLGITMASLALGWIGEPAFADLIEPAFTAMGVESERVLHTVSFIVAFTVITSLHLVIGEQAPKIFAIRRPEVMLLWCAVPMKFFFIMSYPLMAMLNWTTTVILGWLGLKGSGEHGEPVSQDEFRVMLGEAHQQGFITRAEHSLINAVFEFDDLVCRRIMLPRGEVAYFDLTTMSYGDCLELARRTRHTRFPVCNGSMDEVVGVVHVKDFIGVAAESEFDMRSVMRPPKKVPENMPISKLLKHFQATHQLMAFVIDEYGNTIGIVTLENVLEEIIGNVDDEFDTRQDDIVKDGPDSWIIQGGTAVEEVQKTIGIAVNEGDDVDTFAGLLTTRAQKLLSTGDTISLPPFAAEVLEARDDRIVRVRVFRKAE